MPIERYSVGFECATTAVAPGDPYAEFLAGARDPVSIRAISVSSSSNVGGDIALRRSFAIGTAAASGIYTGVAHFAGATTPTGPARVQVAWTSSGVSPTGYVSNVKDEILPVATGQTRQLWDASVDGPLLIEPSKSLLLINQGSGIHVGGFHVNITWEEGRR